MDPCDNPSMRRLLLVAPALVLSASACGGGGGGGTSETGRVTVQLIVPPAGSPDPFQGVDRVRVRVLHGTTIVLERDFGANDPIEIPGIPPGADRIVEFEGYDAADARVAHGRTAPFAFAEGQDQTLPLWFARANSFNDVHGAVVPREGAATVSFSDGRVLIAGGLDGNAAVATAQIFDWETDSVLPSGTMGTARAYASIALLDPDTLLVAGGITSRNQATASAATDVFVYQPASRAGTWAAGVPSMGTARREAGALALGTGVAAVAGGDDGAPLASTEVFQWDGSTGSWTAGPDLAVARAAPIALSLGGGRGIVGGGWAGGGGGGAYSRSTDLLTWSGTALSVAPAADLGDERSFARVVPLSPGTWLMAGGLDDGGLMDTTEVLTANGAGTDVTSAAGPALPVPMRRGGGAPHGNGALLVGGDDGTGFGPAPLDEAFLYDGGTIGDLGTTAGTTARPTLVPLPDGSFLVVADDGVQRYNPQ